MSRTKPHVFQLQELKHRCELCDAAPGEWCRTLNGYYARYLHAPRYYAARAAARKAGRWV